MSSGAILFMLLTVLGWALLSQRLRSAPLTGPLVAMVAGYLIAQVTTIETDSAKPLTYALAELTLIVVLFSDAARIDLKALLYDHDIPRRMLMLGLPGTIALGTIIGLWVFPEFSFWSAALLAAMLAPTDAALGEAVVSNPSVPERIRQSLSVESGLNDGLVLPIVLLFACFTGYLHDNESSADWLIFGTTQIGFGLLAGVLTGYAGARMLRRAIDRQSLHNNWQGVAMLALAGIAWAAAELVHGNGFIAAFTGGLVFGNQLQRPVHFLFEFAETEGQILVLGTFALFGAALLPAALDYLSPAVVIYALLSLTVIRMLPVVVSQLCTSLQWSSRLFLAWFGPRGLASILFALLIAEQSGVPDIDLIEAIVFTTASASIVLHGITAGPLSTLYGRSVSIHEGENACNDSLAKSDQPTSREDII